MTLAKILMAHDACYSGYAWAKRKTAKQAWETCERSDWMLWALRKIRYDDQKKSRLLACRFVRETPLGDGRTVWDLLTDQRSRTAVEVSERYAIWQATDIELNAAMDAAWSARAAAWAAAWAARAAARSARASAWAAQADMIRQAIPWETIAPLVAAIEEE